MNTVDFIKNYIKIEQPGKVLVPFDLYPAQEELLEMIDTHDKVICKNARQVGMSSVHAAYALAYALANPGTTTILTSDNGRMANGLLSLVRQMISVLDQSLGPINLTVNNKQELRFDNGSTIKSLSSSNSNNFRGLTISCLIIDDAAFIKNLDELLEPILPTVQPNTKIVITSTPPDMESDNTFTRWYIDALKNKNDFAPYYIDWLDVPGRDKQFKNDMINNIGKYQWAVEYEMGNL